jgi:hypothetical protein
MHTPHQPRKQDIIIGDLVRKAAEEIRRGWPDNVVWLTPLPAVLQINRKYGWKLFPARFKDGKKYSWLWKRKNENDRSDRARDENWGMTDDPAQLTKDFSDPRWKDECGIGLPTGIVNELFVVEADTKEGHDVDGLASLARLQKNYGKLPDTLMVRSPTGSLHYYFKHPGEGFKVKLQANFISGYSGIDCKGDGGMVVIPPTKRPDKDDPYEWVNQLPIAEAPQWLLAMVTEAARGDTDTATYDDVPSDDPYRQAADEERLPPPTFEQLMDAVEYAENDDLDFDEWNRLGMSIFTAFPNEDGFKAFDAFSQKSTKYNVKIKTRRKWKAYFTCPPDRGLTIATFLGHAKKSGWSRSDYDESGIDDLNDAAPESNDDNTAPGSDDDNNTDSKKRSAFGFSWRWNWHGEVAVEDSCPYLIENLLPETGYGLMSGQWGTYKTFVAFDLAAAVMAGPRFIEFPVRRQGGVLFIACEGHSEVTKRLEAVVKEKCPGLDRAPFAWMDACPRLLDSKGAKILAAMVRDGNEQMQRDFGVPVVLVIIDTAGKAAGYTKTGEGNDDATNKIISRACGAVARACNVFVLGVDHFGKDASVGTKGTSGKEDDAEVVLALLGNKDITGKVDNPRLCLRKRRGGENGAEYPFTFRVIDLGENQYGTPITTLVIDWTAPDGIAEPKEAKSPWERTAPLRHLHRSLQAVTTTIKDWEIGGADDQVPPQAVDRELVREEFYARYPADGDKEQKAETRRKAFNRAITEAQKLKVLGLREGEDGVARIWVMRE